MKKYFIILMLAFVAFAGIAQNAVPNVASNGVITKEAYVSLWGSTADTLTNADTISYILRVRGTNEFDIKAQLYLDYVSGTAAGKLKTYKSIDGVNWVVTAEADSITATSVTADILDTEELTFSDYLSPYLKFIYIQSDTAVTVPKIYIYAKLN